MSLCLSFPPASKLTCMISFSDTFVYEYVGEVIGPTAFAKRMKGYAEGGIRHFYFMALDREVVRRLERFAIEPAADSLHSTVH